MTMNAPPRRLDRRRPLRGLGRDRRDVGRFVHWVQAAHERGFLLDGGFAGLIGLRLLARGRLSVLLALVRGMTVGGGRPGGPREAALGLLATEMQGSARAQYLIGAAWLMGNHPVAAEAALQRALTLRPGFLPARALLGGTWFHLGYFERAATLLAEVVAKAPRRVRAWVWLGNTLTALGRYDEAEAAYRRALACRPKSAELLLRLADHLLYRHEPGEARGLLLKAARIRPEIYRQFWNGRAETRPSEAMLAQMMLYQAYVRVAHNLQVTGRGGEMIPYLEQAIRAQEAAAALVRDRPWLTAHGLSSADIRILPPIWGHLISHTAVIDRYLKMMALGWSPKKRVILLAPESEVVNRAYLDYWRGHIEIVTDPQRIAQMLPAAFAFGDLHSAGHRLADGAVDWMCDVQARAAGEWGRRKGPALLALKPDQRAAGRRILAENGIPAEAWFVCLHVREPGFFGEGDHPYAKFRNGDIANFTAAVEAIRARGGYVVRVGDATMTPYPPTPGVFDYALSAAKADWMDVFLCAECRFFIGSTSGFYFVPSSFGVPCVLVNWVSFCPNPGDSNHIFLPKLLFRREGATPAPLSFAEMFDRERRWVYCDGRVLQEHGLEAVENTPDEIRDAVEEMLDRFEGRSETAPGDAERLAKFAAATAGIADLGAASISTRFLRRHAALLDG